MPIVSIRMAKGRGIDRKRRAVAQSLDLPPEFVSIQIEEFDRENWATGGELHIDRFGPGCGTP
jgi:4-oxalocrotonate tautomerase